MEKIRAFLQGLTFFQWLALIAFLFASISVINAFFSLKTRYDNWLGMKSKKEFDERIKELQTQVTYLEKHRNKPTVFFVRVLLDLPRVAILFIFSFILFLISYLTEVMSMMNRFLFGTLSIAVSVFTISILMKLLLLIRRMYEPEEFAKDVVDFIKSADSKGLTSEEADHLVVMLAKSNALTEEEHDVLMGHITRNYPKPLTGVELTRD